MTKVFLIVDDNNVVWGVAPTLVQARKQAAWFLPKSNYNIFMDWIS